MSDQTIITIILVALVWSFILAPLLLYLRGGKALVKDTILFIAEGLYDGLFFRV